MIFLPSSEPVNDKEPEKWDEICDAYDDVYWIRGNVTTSNDFNRANIRDAFSVVFLASRDSVTQVCMHITTRDKCHRFLLGLLFIFAVCAVVIATNWS